MAAQELYFVVVSSNSHSVIGECVRSEDLEMLSCRLAILIPELPLLLLLQELLRELFNCAQQPIFSGHCTAF